MKKNLFGFILLSSLFPCYISSLKMPFLDYSINKYNQIYNTLGPAAAEEYAKLDYSLNKYDQIYNTLGAAKAEEYTKNINYSPLAPAPFISPSFEGLGDYFKLAAVAFGPSFIILAKNLYHDIIPFIKQAYRDKRRAKHNWKKIAYALSLRYAIPVALLAHMAKDMIKEVVCEIPYYTVAATRYAMIMEIILKNFFIWYGPQLLADAAFYTKNRASALFSIFNKKARDGLATKNSKNNSGKSIPPRFR